MQASHTSSNPLVLSIVHSSFKQSITELGLPDFPQEVFLNEIPAFLHRTDSIFEDTPETLQKLWSALTRGQVIAAEMKDDLAIIFYVRAIQQHRCMDIRIIYDTQTWHIDTVVSMYIQKLRYVRWFQRSIVSGIVVVAGLLGYFLHNPQPVVAPTKATVASNTLVHTTQSKLPSVNDSEQNAKPPSATPAQSDQSSAQKKVAVAKPAIKQLSFNLKEGMPLDDLSQFLKSHHLVQSTVSFDTLMHNTQADRDVKPGTYHFTTNMTQKQLIQVVKRGPTGS